MKKLFFIAAFMLSLVCMASAQSSQPYSRWYGYNSSYDDYTPHSRVTVKAPYSSDVVVIIKKGNQNGSVAGHRNITKGSTASIDLKNGTYQVFFYYGSKWASQKYMGSVNGGFLEDEAFSKDNPVSLNNNELTYELVLQKNGNFNTKHSSKGEIF